ncbi:MAG: hypothetical protein LM577_06970 [Thermoproteaceae archaeon]|jgi:hypothetical protein|nr:hypothetical protein [Thermoproteaceae archaeon]
MEDVVAAVVFIAALSALLALAALTLEQYMPAGVVEAPVAPAHDAPARRIYVYNDSGRLYAVEYAGSDAEAFRRAAGVPGSLVAAFEVYPGGYRCARRAGAPVRIGDDPYTGLWCPPPVDANAGAGCAPIGITSRGRWLLVQYRCPGLP